MPSTKERRQRVLELIQKNGFAALPDLAKSLRVSESTIRRDLAHLEREGGAKRTHGGAFLTSARPRLPHWARGDERTWACKRAIGAAAAALLSDGDTVLLDGGGTTYELAQRLIGRTMQVLTNSLPLANLLTSASGIDLVVIGGYVHGPSGAMHGDTAVRMLDSIRAPRAVLGAAAINEAGLANNNQLIVSTQQAMLRAAEEVIVVADSSKFGHTSLAPLCKLSEVHTLVVDDGLSDAWRARLESQGVNVVVAEVTPDAIGNNVGA